MILLFGAAYALDGHGSAVIPGAQTAEDPLLMWTPEGLGRGWAFGLTTEYASGPLVGYVDDGETAYEQAVLDQLLGTTVSGSGGFGRFGVGLSVPIWWLTTGEAAGDPTLGDLLVAAPIVLRPPEDGAFGLTVVPELRLPTGAVDRYLGSGIGAGLRLVGGGRGARAGGSVELGGAWFSEAVAYDVDRTVLLRLAAAGDVQLFRQGTLGLEGWIEAAPLSFSTANLPAEVLGRFGLGLDNGLSFTLAGGTAVAPGVGAGDFRALLRVGWHSPTATTKAVPAPQMPVGPYTVRISVVDAEGGPIDATVSVSGTSDVPAATTGKDGALDVTLSPGTFDVFIGAPGYTQQRQRVTLEPERFRPAVIRAVLQPSQGEASLTVRVQDSEGRPVDGAELRIDGKEHGTLSTAGEVQIAGLLAGAHRLDVVAPAFRPEAPVSADTSRGVAAVVLDRAPGSVRVVCRGPNGPVPDAVVRFLGPEDRSPAAIGPEGEAHFVLVPGDWDVVVSAEAFGLQQRSIHIEPGRTTLVEVDVRLRDAEEGDASLLVRVIDPDGAPVLGADVRLGGRSVGTTSNGGELRVDGLAAGPQEVVVAGPRHRPTEPQSVVLRSGVRELDVMLGWRPGTVEVVARGIEGALTDAEVRFDGPEPVPASRLGPDGRNFYQLVPGTWQLALSAASYGVQEREVIVRPDDTQLVEIDASLLARMGEAALGLVVTDPSGDGVVGARVFVNGRDAGTTASGGRLSLEGLSPGEHTIEVQGAIFAPWTRAATLTAGENHLAAALGWTPTNLKVRARSADAPASDALARFYGASERPPTALVPTGERWFSLEPGAWTLVVSSPRFGLAEQDLQVAPGDPRTVDVTLRPIPVETARLYVSVVDPAGRPVRGATLQVGDQKVPVPDSGMTLLDVPPGDLRLAVSAPGFKSMAPETLALTPGIATRRLKLVPVPRAVEVSVVDEAGKAVPATVRLSGPGKAQEQRVSGAARVSVMPGTWQVLVEAKGFGAWRADVVVPPGEGAVPVTASLAGIKAEVTETGVALREQVQFDFDQATIRPESYPLLEQVAAMLLLRPELASVEVQGHTDARGTEPYNLDLSQRRAEAVVAYLARRGVDPGRLTAQGYGATRPVAGNEDESGRTKNRRVQFEIVGRGG